MIHDFESLAFLAKSCVRSARTMLVYRQFLKNQHLSPDELSELNWNKRKRLLHHAFDNVSFYRKRFSEAGLHPSDIKCAEDFETLPLLTKEDLREHLDELVSQQAFPRHLHASTTGGSTGVPVKVYHDARFPQNALCWRMMRWWGLMPGIHEAIVWRSLHGSTGSRWYDRPLRVWPTKKIWLDASSISPDDILRFVQEFNRLRPRLLQGYAGAVAHVALFIEQNRLNIAPPDAVWMTSSPISTVQRHLVETVFQAPVYDQYGACEVHWLAAQCGERGGLHINFDSRYIEFVDEKACTLPVGTSGRIAVTDLDNYACPLIRYLIGDVGRLLPNLCECGISLPIMDSVKGRVSDLIKMPDGTCISGDHLTTIFDNFPDAVKQFQVYQKEDYSIILYAVPAPDCMNSVEIQGRVLEELRLKTKKQVSIKIVQTDEIRSDRGKTRYVISDVK